jgi:tetratricopeptide (TPR) repeat protein
MISSIARPAAIARRALLTIACCVVCMLASSVAVAQNAAELDKKARAAFERKDFEVAARTFEEAYRLKPHPATQYNAALAWEKAGELARAADAFESALDSEGLDDGRATASRERLAALKRQLGYAFVTKPIGATVSVAHAENLSIPAKIHLAPGNHELTVRRSDGTTSTETISVRAGEAVQVAVAAGGLNPSPIEPAPEDDPRPTPADPTEPDRADDSCSQCTWGWVAIGGAAVAAGVGTYFGLKTISARDEFEDSDRQNDDARERAIEARTASNVAFGVAVVAGTVGVILLLTGGSSGEPKKESANTRTELRIGPRSVSAAFHF